MRANRRASQMVGIGLLTMVVGALLPFTTAGAGNHATKVTICHATAAVENPYVVNRVSYNSASGSIGNGQGDHAEHTGPVFDFDDPESNEGWGDIIPPVGDFPGLNWDEGGSEIHAAGCEAPGADPTTLTVKKVVDGDDPPETWTVPFTVDGDEVDLTQDDPEADPIVVEPGEEYVITEDDDLDADATEIECEDAATSVVDGLSVTVTVAEGADAVCTFTNTYDGDDPDPATLTVVKRVVGPAPVGDFSFSVLDDTGTEVAGFDLARNGSSDPIELDAGEYTLTETEDRDAAGVAVSCTNEATGAESVDLTLGEGDDVTCTFTNTFTSQGSVPDPIVPDPDPATLTIVKEVAGTADSWSFDFDGDLGEFELTAADPEHEVTDLEPGDYTIGELAGPADDGFTVGSVSCDDEAGTEGTIAEDAETGEVTVTLAAGDDVTCTFVNLFAEVGATPNTPVQPQPQERPDVRPAETVREPAEPETAVLGATTVRTLPVTGSSSHLLAAAGFALVMLGIALSIVGRMRRTAMR